MSRERLVREGTSPSRLLMPAATLNDDGDEFDDYDNYDDFAGTFKELPALAFSFSSFSPGMETTF